MMLHLDGAKQLLKRSNLETAKSVFPEQTTIVTSAIRLSSHRPSLHTTTSYENRMEEAEVVEEFEPAYHIPADPPQYVECGRERGEIEPNQRLFGETRWMHNRLQDCNTEIVPCVRCWSAFNSGCFDSLLDEIDPPSISYTVTALESRSARAWGDTTADSHTPPVDCPLLIIGCMEPDALIEKKVPENTVGAAGLHHWRQQVQPEHQTKAEITRSFDELQANVSAVLDHQQSVSADHRTPFTD